MSRRLGLALLALALCASAALAETLEQTLERAAQAANQGRADEAVALLEARLARAGPEDDLVPLRGMLGDVDLLANDPGPALAHYDWIAAQQPDHARAHYKRGQALERASRMEEAIQAYHRAGDLGHEASDALARIGFCYKVLAEREGTPAAERERYLLLAAQRLSRAIQLDTRNGSALGNMADLAFNSGDYPSALKLYLHMDRIQPSKPTTLARLGSTYASLGRHAQAIETLRRAAQLAETGQPVDFADRWVYRDAAVFSRIRIAESLIALGRRAEARGELQRVLELADCGDCRTTTCETERSRERAQVLLEELGTGPVPAAPQRAAP
jgi:tetratricopeptide (TPR) repeat protein